MIRILSLVALCATAIACDGDRSSGPTGRRVYTLSGTVRDGDGAPVQGARAQILTGEYNGRFADSDQNGLFKFVGVTGSMVVRVLREDFEPFQASLDVLSDTAVALTIRRIVFWDTIELGRTYRAIVSANAGPCDPERWDAVAPCRRLYFTPSFAGLLSVDIKWNGEPPLDAALVIPPGNYVAFSRDSGSNRVILTARLVKDVRYELRVHSYYGEQSFDFMATYTP